MVSPLNMMLASLEAGGYAAQLPSLLDIKLHYSACYSDLGVSGQRQLGHGNSAQVAL